MKNHQEFNKHYSKLAENLLNLAFIKVLDKKYTPSSITRNTVMGWYNRENVPIQYRVAVIDALNEFKHFINNDEELLLFDVFPDTEHIYGIRK